MHFQLNELCRFQKKISNIFLKTIFSFESLGIVFKYKSTCFANKWFWFRLLPFIKSQNIFENGKDKVRHIETPALAFFFISRKILVMWFLSMRSCNGERAYWVINVWSNRGDIQCKTLGSCFYCMIISACDVYTSPLLFLPVIRERVNLPFTQYFLTRAYIFNVAVVRVYAHPHSAENVRVHEFYPDIIVHQISNLLYWV